MHGWFSWDLILMLPEFPQANLDGMWPQKLIALRVTKNNGHSQAVLEWPVGAIPLEAVIYSAICPQKWALIYYPIPQ